MSSAHFAGLRVAVIGSCQVSGLAPAVQQLLPGCTLESFHVDVYPPLTRAEIAERAAKADFVVTQIDAAEDDPLSLVALTSKVRNVQFLPVLVFLGLHPDLEFVSLGDGVDARHVSGKQHSTILAASFLLGLSVERAVRLFNSYIFSRLGYFRAYEESCEAVTARFQDAGYDLSGQYERWLRNGPFMYGRNHPAIQVLATLARLVVDRSGLRSNSVDPTGLRDFLASQIILPVYPELAARLGVRGGREVLLAEGTEGTRTVLPLTDYAHASYSLYRNANPARLRTPRIVGAAEKLSPVIMRP